MGSVDKGFQRRHSGMPDAATIAVGHVEYKEWLRQVGACFSPLSRSTEAHAAGNWTSWTVEGLYQGLKRIRLFDPTRLVRWIEASWIEDDRGTQIVHFPAIMDVERDLIRHPLFQLLKSGKRYNAKRNRYLGRLSSGKRNWEFTNTWLHPVTGATMSCDEFSRCVTRPTMRAHLRQFPQEVADLKAAWSRGEYPITEPMKQAHAHLRLVEEFVTSEEISET